MAFDLVVRGAQLRNRPDLVDLGIADGRVAQVASNLATEGAAVIEAAGRLVVPGFVDSHIHIGKSFYGRETHRYDYRQGEWMGIQMTWNDASKTLSLRLAKGSKMLAPLRRKIVAKMAKTEKAVTFDGLPLTVRM